MKSDCSEIRFAGLLNNGKHSVAFDSALKRAVLFGLGPQREGLRSTGIPNEIPEAQPFFHETNFPSFMVSWSMAKRGAKSVRLPQGTE